ncbi:MAG: exodeoxyribonuclease V subunit gamma, partial [Microthrixaceae bacterium]
MLHVHSAGELRLLADGLAEVLSVAPADPMEPEFVAVPSAGMRTWLSLQLARHLGRGTGAEGLTDGVSANIEFPFPGSLRLRLLEAEGSTDRGSDPW